MQSERVWKSLAGSEHVNTRWPQLPQRHIVQMIIYNKSNYSIWIFEKLFTDYVYSTVIINLCMQMDILQKRVSYGSPCTPWRVQRRITYLQVELLCGSSELGRVSEREYERDLSQAEPHWSHLYGAVRQPSISNQSKHRPQTLPGCLA